MRPLSAAVFSLGRLNWAWGWTIRSARGWRRRWSIPVPFAASFSEASNHLVKLADLSISAERIRRACRHVGNDRTEQQQQLLGAYLSKPLPKRCYGKPADIEPPEIACVMADGGRYQVLDRRRSSVRGRSARKGEHWKESCIGLLAGMSGDRYERDPHPELPFALRYDAVAEKLSDIGKTRARTRLARRC